VRWNRFSGFSPRAGGLPEQGRSWRGVTTTFTSPNRSRLRCGRSFESSSFSLSRSKIPQHHARSAVCAGPQSGSPTRARACQGASAPTDSPLVLTECKESVIGAVGVRDSGRRLPGHWGPTFGAGMDDRSWRGESRTGRVGTRLRTEYAVQTKLRNLPPAITPRL